MKKRFFTLALALVMVLSLFSGLAISVAAAPTLVWPAAWEQGTPPDWALYASQEVKDATIQAMTDEYAYQASIGFDMGTDNGGITAWGNMVNAQFENGGHTTNPWGQTGRRMGGIIAPFPGTAFSIKADASNYYGVVPLGNETQYSGGTVQMLTDGQLVTTNGTMTKNGMYAGSGAPAAVREQFQKAYAEAAAGVSFGYRVSLGYAAGAVQVEDGIYYQEFWSNETNGTLNGRSGVSFIVGNAADAYVIKDGMFTSWINNYQSGNKYFANTGIPTSNEYTVNGVVYQDFANGALVWNNGSVTGPVDNDTSFALGFQYEQMVSEGDHYYYLVSNDVDPSALDSGIKPTSANSTLSPSLAGRKDYTKGVSFSITAKSGRVTNYTVTVLSRKAASAADAAAAGKVNDMLAQVPVVLFRNDLDNIEAIQAAYNELTVAQKLLVDMSAVDALAERVAELRNSDPIRITCVGDSITDGYKASSAAYSYPSQMQGILGDGYVVTNCGVSGSMVRTNRDSNVYINTNKYQTSINSEPDIVIVALGTNDAGSGWAGSEAQFETDYRNLLNTYLNLPTKPLVMASLPAVSWYGGSNDRDDRSKNNENGTIPIIKKVAVELNVPTIDIWTWSSDKRDYFVDGLHPGDEGYAALAAEYAKHVLAATEISLDGIRLDGTTMAEFDPEIRNYRVEVDSMKDLPNVSAIYTASSSKTVTVTQATTSNPTATVIVDSTIGDCGAAYSVTFYLGADGNVNGDDTVDTADMAYMKALILQGSWTDEQLAAGDLNGDGKLTVSDIMLLKARLCD